MTIGVDLAARLLAAHQGRATRIAMRRRVRIQPDAMIFCPIGMAGEDATIHIAAVGRIGKPGRILFVPDPRRRDDQDRLFSDLFDEIETYAHGCARAGTFPQIWTPAPAAAELVDLLAERLRWRRLPPDSGRDHVDWRVRQLGRWLSYFAERRPIAGQQALLVATGVLGEHYATGQSPAEDGHLGSFLAWLQGGPDVYARAAEAQRVPMSTRTDPEFDEKHLAPVVEAFNKARRNGADGAARHAAATIERLLSPVVLRIYDATQEAISILSGKEWVDLRYLGAMTAIERRAFRAHVRVMEEDLPIWRTDTPREAAFRIEEREAMLEAYTASIQIDDPLARAVARATGHVFRGLVVPTNGRTVSLRSDQTMVRLRKDDTWRLVENPEAEFKVQDVRTEESGDTVLTIALQEAPAGFRMPAVGKTVELIQRPPDWFAFDSRYRRRIANRTAPAPWTHPAGAPIRAAEIVEDGEE